MYNLHLTHSIFSYEVSHPEPRGQRGPQQEVPRHGDEVPRHWKGQLPCHSRKCGQSPRTRLYRWAKPCCSVSNRTTTAARRSQSTKTRLSAFLRHFIATPTTENHGHTTHKPRPNRRATNINTCHFKGKDHHHDNRAHTTATSQPGTE